MARETSLEFGIVGLGRMGGSLALQALEKGARVAGYDPGGARAELIAAGLVACGSLSELRERLRPPRAVLLYVPAGTVVDELLDRLADALQAGDVVADGGNSYWGDSIRRYRRMRARQLGFVDVGTSGGVAGARHGACFMAGGEPGPVGQLAPVLERLAVAGGYVHAGPPGAGHYAKLVHNGIEFGMLQAIGEGVSLLGGYREPLDVAAILRCWRNGSVIRSWLIDLLEQGWRDEQGLARIPPYVEDTGEVNWLVSDAMRMEIPVPVIAAAVMQLAASRDGTRDWARAIAVMRHGFGGHPYGADEAIRNERQTGRVGDYLAGSGQGGT